MIRGNRVKVNYDHQNMTCGRCAKYWSACPGGGKVDKCKRAGGEEKPTAVAFKELLKRISKKNKEGRAQEDPIIPGIIPDPDHVKFTGFPEGFSREEFMKWLDDEEIDYLDPMVFKGGKPGVFMITSLRPEDGDQIILSGEEGKKIEGEHIHAYAHTDIHTRICIHA